MSKNELLHDDFNVAQTACQVLKLEDITDQKIKFAMSKIWPGHGFAEPDSFKTVESAIEYCLKVEESCDEKLTQVMSDVIMVNATSLLRRHHISQVIRAMIRLEPVESVRDKCCKAFNISVPDFYALKNLCDTFTEHEIFYFGMHGGTFPQVKCLAMIEDDSTRKLVMNKFCTMTDNVLDAHKRAAATKMLNQAVSIAVSTMPALMEGTETEEGEDGESVPAQDPIDLVPEKVRAAAEAIKKFIKVVALVSPGTCSKTQEVLMDLSMEGVESGTAAEQFAMQMLADAGTLQKDVNALLERLTDVKQELDSVVAAYGDGIHNTKA